jgi:rod shape-determining protein MreC
MDPRIVRRRRLVLAALVALSLGLLTAYWGESSGGGLHSIQRGAMEVLAPIQEGANRALKPFRDLFGWFGDTLDAKEERDALRKERDELRRQVDELALARSDFRALREMREKTEALGWDQYDPVPARTIERSASIWYSKLIINKGSSDGVEVGQPVVTGGGLVGKVRDVSPGSAAVMLITDKDFGVAARSLERNEPGTIAPNFGSSDTLLFDLVARAREVREGDRIVTAGTTDPALRSPYPRGIPIGTVKRIEAGEGDLDRRIYVDPSVDLRRVEFMQVLTKPESDLRASVGATP